MVRFLVIPFHRNQIAIHIEQISPPRADLQHLGGITMHRGFSTILIAVALAAIAALAPSPTRAQASSDKEKPAMYTYVSEWAVARGDWAAYEKTTAGDKPLFDKLIADGTIVAYGTFKNLVHQEGAPTHGDWWTATSMANLMKALSALMTQSSTPDANKVLGNAKHWDFVITSRNYGYHPGTYENTYLRVGQFKAKAGEGEAMEKALKSYIVPTLEKMLADGAIHFYSVDHEAVHTGDPGAIDIAIITNGADGLDKFTAALEAAGKASPTGPMAFGSTSDSSAHRDILALTSATYK